MATIPFLNNTSFSAKVTFTGDVEIARPNGATGVLLIKGGKNVVSAVGEINSELNFGSNDGSIPDRIGGSIKSVTEFNNGARVGMAFHTANQSGSPVLQEAVRINYEGNVGIGNTNPSDYSADANNLVVGSLSGNNGITILSTSSSGYGSIYFADSTTGNKVYSGFIRYQQNQSNMTFGTNEVERMRIDVNGNTSFTGNVTISKADTPLFQLVDTTNNVSLLMGADNLNTFPH